MTNDKDMQLGAASNAELGTDGDGFDADGFNVNALLFPALRQYQHNDGSGFVVGYDHAETQKIALKLLKDIARLLELASSSVEISQGALDVAKL